MEHLNMDDFDVLRLIEHGKKCYISSENVRGVQLIYWLKDHTSLSKEELFGWIRELTRQLAQIHKCRGAPNYRYVNPYSVIITQERELYYLDADALSNEERIRQMQRPNVREYFLPPNASYYQEASEELDVYGLGKTIQYLVAVTDVTPALTRGEEKKLQKVITRCLTVDTGKPCVHVADLQKSLPRYRKKASGRPGRWTVKVLALLALIVTVVAAVCILCRSLSKEETTPEEDLPGLEEDSLLTDEERQYLEDIQELVETSDALFGEDSAARNSDTNGPTNEQLMEALAAEASENEALHMELGFLYFLKAEDYENSSLHFWQVNEDPSAEALANIADYLKNKEGDPALVRQQLRKAYEASEEASVNQSLLCQCLLKGYQALDDPVDDDEIIRLGEKCLEKEKVTDDFTWIRSLVATSCERQAQYEKAEMLYTEWMQDEFDPAVREELHEKLASLYEMDGKPEKAADQLRDGIAEFPSDVDLRIYYAGFLTRDTSMDRKQCAEALTNCIKELPELTEEEEFQKLLKENGMKIKKGKVCIER